MGGTSIASSLGVRHDLLAEPLVDSPLIALAAPARAAGLPIGNYDALAADALQSGRLVRVSPLAALRAWLDQEMALSWRALRPPGSG